MSRYKADDAMAARTNLYVTSLTPIIMNDWFEGMEGGTKSVWDIR